MRIEEFTKSTSESYGGIVNLHSSVCDIQNNMMVIA